MKLPEGNIHHFPWESHELSTGPWTRLPRAAQSLKSPQMQCILATHGKNMAKPSKGPWSVKILQLKDVDNVDLHPPKIPRRQQQSSPKVFYTL